MKEGGEGVGLKGRKGCRRKNNRLKNVEEVKKMT